MGEELEPLTGRAEQMARSLGAALRGRELPPDEVDVVLGVFALAMRPRIAQLDDDHHPAWLHPGRSALILLHDVETIDSVVLVVAALHESIDASLRLSLGSVEEAIGPAARAALEALPLPGDERLTERLLLLGPGQARAVLAERLDHLRHLHLRKDLLDLWADTHEEVSQVWLPFAARIDPTLTRRYAHWVRTFVKRI